MDMMEDPLPAQEASISHDETQSMPATRYGLYFTPPMNDPLVRAAASWLGRDAFSGMSLAHPVIPGLSSQTIADLTAAPRRYGFHATLKAPFALADEAGAPEFLEELMRFCGRFEPFMLPKLAVTRLGPFFALTPSAPSPELESFAASVVMHFDRFRRPLSEADIARRDPARLTAQQQEYLQHWGYPYVLDAFRFHMTLTGPVAATERDAVESVLRKLFDPLLDTPPVVANLALFTEAEPGADFVVHSLHPIGSIGASTSP
jgi:putative phosphonate metabolism protein